MRGSASALLLVVSPGPLAESNGVACPFVEGLPEELGTCPPMVYPSAFSAPDEDGRNPAELLQLGGGGVAIPLRSQSG